MQQNERKSQCDERRATETAALPNQDRAAGCTVHLDRMPRTYSRQAFPVRVAMELLAQWAFIPQLPIELLVKND